MAADCYLTLDLPNVRLRALAWGPQDGPLVICGHGFPDSAHTWRLLGPRLGPKGGVWWLLSPEATRPVKYRPTPNTAWVP